MASNSPRFRAILLLVVLFVLGLGIGSLGGWYCAAHHFRGPRHTSGWLMKELTRDLALTSQQQGQVQAIIDDTRSKFRTLDTQVRSQQDQIRQSARSRIRAVLTPEQLPRFDQFVRRLDEQRKKEAHR
jgi:Heavy-metal resistance